MKNFSKRFSRWLRSVKRWLTNSPKGPHVREYPNFTVTISPDLNPDAPFWLIMDFTEKEKRNHDQTVTARKTG